MICLRSFAKPRKVTNVRTLLEARDQAASAELERRGRSRGRNQTEGKEGRAVGGIKQLAVEKVACIVCADCVGFRWLRAIALHDVLVL